MIPKIQARGKSFTGLATYLTHDPKEKTSDRLAWTHTLNLAHDHVPSAVDEMLWTARAAELLKQEAGTRGGGRATESPVKHFSLNWSPEDDPTREHMIETAEDFLRHMKWQDHQALLVAHNDKPYAHVHVMVNAVHPETGLRLNEDFENRRAQAWALAYEQEHGKIYCEQRLLHADERENAPTRPAWLAFQEKQKEFEAQEKTLDQQNGIFVEERDNSKIANFADWKRLKDIQRRERESFFAEGKLAFSELRRSVYREVREEFRERWADLYAAQKQGDDPEATGLLKKELVAQQNELLGQRRDEAYTTLREARGVFYRELLDDQRDIRHQMRWRQEAGLDNALFLQRIDERDAGRGRQRSTFRGAAEETTSRQDRERNLEVPAFVGHERRPAGNKSEVDVGANIASGLGFGLLSIFGSIADGLIGATPEPKPRQPEPIMRADPFDAVVEETRKREQHERKEAEGEWYRKQRSYGE